MRGKRADPSNALERVAESIRKQAEMFGPGVRASTAAAHRLESMLASARLDEAVDASKMVDRRLIFTHSIRVTPTIGCPF
jgi:chemotaxis protein histidine kinase CheA